MVEYEKFIYKGNRINADWHIHSEHSCDSASLKMEDLVKEAELLGITHYGVTDHIHSVLQFPDIENSKSNYDLILKRYPGLKGRFHFGVEVSCMSEWELDKIRRGDYKENAKYGLRKGGPDGTKPAIELDGEFINKMGIEYVVGGVHWPLYCSLDRETLIKHFHKQYLYIINHEHVDILAHYLLWLPIEGVENPFHEFGNVPVSMRREIISALKQNNCAFEINLEAMILSQRVTEKFAREYLEFTAELQSEGVTLSIGGDCHFPHYNQINFERADKMIGEAGIDTEKNMFYIN